MSQPAQPPLLRRAIIAFGIVVLCLLLLALIGWMSGGWDEAQGRDMPMPDVYQGVPLDAHLLELDKRALDASYQAQLGKLFNIWLTDGAQESSRIKTGLANARRAYGEAAGQIARREQELSGKKSP